VATLESRRVAKAAEMTGPFSGKQLKARYEVMSGWLKVIAQPSIAMVFWNVLKS